MNSQRLLRDALKEAEAHAVKKMTWKKRTLALLVAGLALGACGGSGDSEPAGSDPVAPPPSLVKNSALSAGWTIPCSFGGACRLGDIGPGGGIVVYRGETKINAVDGVSAGGVYLEFYNYTANDTSNKADGRKHSWGCQDTLINGADSKEVGAGAQNTKDIVNGCSDTQSAAYVAMNATVNEQSDWFLPSKTELNMFCQYVRGQTPSTDSSKTCDKTKPYLTTLPDKILPGSRYLVSSTEENARRAMLLDLTDKDFNLEKGEKYNVGFVRAFGEFTPGPIPENPQYQCKHGGACKVGDEGPGGGTVFYVGTTTINSYGSKYPGGKYLEFIDPFPNTTYKFRCVIHVDGTEQGVGSGAKNTSVYKNACSDSDSPISLAWSATNGKKTDWFVPSYGELNLICRYSRKQDTASNEMCNGKLAAIAGANFKRASWSSTQRSMRSMWGVSMGDGTDILRDKMKYSYNFFMVRAFG